MAIRVSTTDGDLLDVITLAEGGLSYQTGEAQELVEGQQDASGMSDTEIYGMLRNWSNGYVVTKEGRASWVEKAAGL